MLIVGFYYNERKQDFLPSFISKRRVETSRLADPGYLVTPGVIW
jgi:hypothetical protein